MGPKKFESSSKKSSRRPPQALGPGVSDLQKGQSVQGDRFDFPGRTGGVGTPPTPEKKRGSQFSWAGRGGNWQHFSTLQQVFVDVLKEISMEFRQFVKF